MLMSCDIPLPPYTPKPHNSNKQDYFLALDYHSIQLNVFIYLLFFFLDYHSIQLIYQFILPSHKLLTIFNIVSNEQNIAFLFFLSVYDAKDLREFYRSA